MQSHNAIAAGVEGHLIAAALELEHRVDDEINSLEQLNDNDLEAIRKQKLRNMQRIAKKKQDWLHAGHGEYIEVFGDKDFFSQTKGEERVVCHFYRASMPCEVMHRHLQRLAETHLETKFIKIQAEKAPFLVERLRVWMLPTLALIKDGKAVDYVVGLGDLAESYDFSTADLAERLRKFDLVFEESSSKQPGSAACRNSAALRRGNASEASEDSDFD